MDGWIDELISYITSKMLKFIIFKIYTKYKSKIEVLLGAECLKIQKNRLSFICFVFLRTFLH